MQGPVAFFRLLDLDSVALLLSLPDSSENVLRQKDKNEQSPKRRLLWQG